MFVYEEAWDYESYLESDLIEYKEKQDEIFDEIQLSEVNITKLSNIKKIVNLVVFAEIYCPDCRVLVPYLEKIRSINSNVNLSIFPRTGNEEYLIKHSIKGRIPTVLMEDLKKGEENFTAIFEEFPEPVRSQIESALNTEQTNGLVHEYRAGVRNSELENHLVKGILGILE